MKRQLSILFIFGAVFFILGCGTAKHIPAGSQPLDVYWGKFTGMASIRGGIIRIRLYQAPDGTKPFTGSLELENTDDMIFFRGSVVGNSLEGTFDAPIHGTISGQQSEDGSQFTGTFDTMEIKDGDWTARKK